MPVTGNSNFRFCLLFRYLQKSTSPQLIPPDILGSGLVPSVTGYLCKNRELRTPRKDRFDRAGGPGYEDDVLNGNLSVEQAFRREADRIAYRTSRPVGSWSNNLEPVLCHHLGLNQPKEHRK
jgi:hypothetical protein